MIEKIKEEVMVLMDACGGHGFDHVERVYKQALKFAAAEKADEEVVGLAALLHDVDDYKFFGEESAANLSNARRIMQENNVSSQTAEKVCTAISTMGYSKALKGIRPETIEGQIVSDADMMDAIGAMGLLRSLVYALERCHGAENSVFDKNIFPELNLISEEYKKPNRRSDNCINHFFEKMLKLKNMMFTASAKQEAEVRHAFMVAFLRQFFIENDCPEWLEYLENFEESQKLAA